MSASDERLAIFGTDEPPPERLELRAGPLSAVFENAGLRDIRFRGVEAVRGVAFLVRDAAWGTARIEIEDRELSETDGVTRLRFTATARAAAGNFAYRAEIVLDPRGILRFAVEGAPPADLLTNRTGFVVLHPAELAGAALTVVHPDGSRSELRFPELISPDQPAFDIAELVHALPGGGRCTISLEGDSFEMEDQRNWSDASFKTYIRPLSRPRPYLLAAGQALRQSVGIRISGSPAAPAAAAPTSAEARLPAFALSLAPQDLDAAEAAADGIGPAQSLVLRLPDAGPEHDAPIGRALALARRIGAALELEFLCALRDPPGEARRIRARIERGEGRIAGLRLGPARDLASHASGAWPAGERPLTDLLAALRELALTLPIGLGTPSFFTEFNRNPPGPGGDFVHFGIAANVHTADDRSVAETLTVYPVILATARARCPGLPIRLGPVSIGMPHTPYGAATAPNPDRLRIAAARSDPRQDGSFAAAFALAVAVRAVLGGVEALTLAEPAGDLGLVTAEGRPRPLLVLHRDLAAHAGAPCRASVDGGHYTLLLPQAGLEYHANLGPRPIALPAAADPLSARGWLSPGREDPKAELPPYQVARVRRG